MRTLHISVLDKKATYLSRDGDIVCGNSDYLIEFAFDAEWDGYDEKTARFIWNGQYQDVKFTGTACYVPIVTHTTELRVGVYAGELSTTTSATIGCKKSVLCESSSQGGTIIVDGDSSGGAGLPVPTADDNGKVLTAKDSKAVWEEPTGGANIITAESVDELPDPSTVKEGTVALIPSEGETVRVYDTLDAVPADLPEGSLVAVPSTESVGSGGLSVVELETEITTDGTETALTENDAAKMDALDGNVPFVLAIPSEGGLMNIIMNGLVVRSGDVAYVAAGAILYVSGATYKVEIGNLSGAWIASITSTT